MLFCESSYVFGVVDNFVLYSYIERLKVLY